MLNWCRQKDVSAKFRFHSILPSLALRQRTERPPDLSPVPVTKTCSPQSTGEEWPPPGNSTFQATSASVILVGILLAWLMPAPLGPRNRVHSWPARLSVKTVSVAVAIIARFSEVTLSDTQTFYTTVERSQAD